MIRRVVFYTGRVQGVGFRFTAQRLAQRFAVAGCVRNLDDGRVRLDAQGEADQVQALLDAVDEAMGSKIVSRDVTDGEVDAALGDPEDAGAFEIRR